MNLLETVAAGLVLVDDEDLQKYGDWVVIVNPDQNNYIKVQIRNLVPPYKYWSLGRLVLNMADPKVEVDHRNLNPRDCRKQNLRTATSSQNKMNRNVRSNSLTGYKGVSRVKTTGRYVASITTKLGKITLGSSSNPIAAALLYDAAATKYFGEFARLNFQPELTPCENLDRKTTNAWSGGDSNVSCSTGAGTLED